MPLGAPPKTQRIDDAGKSTIAGTSSYTSELAIANATLISEIMVIVIPACSVPVLVVVDVEKDRKNGKLCILLFRLHKERSDSVGGYHIGF